ncbi:MAG: transglutaminase family protein [Hyphomicrobium sp.]
MLIGILHTSRYVYDTPANYSVQALRLTPPAFNGQQIVSWTIRAPGIERASSFRDGFGNLTHLVTINGPHSDVMVEAEGVVQTSDTTGVAQGLPEVAPVRVYQRMTPMTAPDDAIRKLAADTGDGDPIGRLHRLMHAVADTIEYVVGETHSETTAAEALARGRGVCQDHAHVLISAARSAGMAARYVNGYMVAEEGEPAEAHHGWAEVWVEGVGWIGFDPANRICPTERYVRLGTGLDAASAAPIRGSRQGGVSEHLDVRVEVAQQGASQQ